MVPNFPTMARSSLLDTQQMNIPAAIPTGWVIAAGIFNISNFSNPIVEIRRLILRNPT